MNLHLVLLVLYSTALVSVGLWTGRRVKDTASFFVAERRLGPGLLCATVLAANIGAGSTVGAAGLGYADGVAAWWWVGSAAIGSLLLALWIGPLIWRDAQRHDLQTAGDWLELRYGSPVRITAAVLLWFLSLTILAGQLIGIAWILEVVAGIPKLYGCLAGGLVMTVYFTAGGLVTLAWINLIQLVVLMAGFAVALPWVLADVGGWDAVTAVGPQISSDWLSFWQGGGSGLNYVALLAPAFIISPGLIQKVYGARDERAVRLGVGASAVLLFAFAAVPTTLGMLARVYAPSLENPELALPTVLTAGLPPFIGSLGLAAILSAEVSSADAILFMLATSLSKDLYKRYLRPGADDRDVLRVARIAAITGGALGIVLAINLESVIDSLKIFYGLLGVSLFVPIIAGLHTRRVGTPEALAAIGAGVAVYVAVSFRPVPGNTALVNPSTLALLASGAAFALLAVPRLRWRQS